MMIGGRESERDHMVDVFLCCSVVGMVGSWLVGVAALSNQETGGEQEQTKFYDLRRGITEDFQRLAKFQRTLSKSTKKITDFKRFTFLTFCDL